MKYNDEKFKYSNIYFIFIFTERRKNQTKIQTRLVIHLFRLTKLSVFEFNKSK